jgi:hypothetical protein
MARKVTFYARARVREETLIDEVDGRGRAFDVEQHAFHI